MISSQTKTKLSKQMIPIFKKNHVKKAGLFGSYARGEQKKKSDLDLVVDMKGSLLDLAGLKIELEEILNKKVDILTYKSIHPLLKKKILNEEVRIYGKG
ncbi:nucleotidyltransferase family protein [Candidatus Woesearchaeota archaeon]|nr:nucleotidyltransferase family protein [Candidatus Woesearchaeota archaeon]